MQLSNKTLWLVIISLVAVWPVFAQDVDKMPTISVTGTAEVQVAPDEVVFTLDVTKTDKDLQTAKRLNDESVGNILELAKRFEVLPQNLKTDYISVQMKYQSVRDPKKKIYDEDGDEIGTRIFKGYEVSKTVIVRLTDIKRFEEFFSEALKSGVSEISSVKFETSKLRENRDKAREMAMKAAREKAVAMSAAINQSVGKAVKIIETGASPPIDGFAANAMRNTVSAGGTFSEPVTTFAPGAIKVEAQILVSFLLN